MGFASAYLEGKTLYHELIPEAPLKGTGIIVVIPSYNENGIVSLLDSLGSCINPGCGAEVIIVVNSPQNPEKGVVAANLKTISDIDTWKKEHPGCFFTLYAVNVTAEKPGWGVGMARKTGMDEAVRRFDRLGRPEGIIVSLDADCTVEENYFAAIGNGFCARKENSACSIYFEHPVSGMEFAEEIYRSVTLYELHLRYYYQGLLYSGYPFAHHTIGSAMACRALAYVRSGGMNRKAAGEDFYFIQKLVTAAEYFDLNTTVVYPSPRKSLRVPFGTGVLISRIAEDRDATLMTYNLDAFNDLKSLFFQVEAAAYAAERDESLAHGKLPAGIRQFISSGEWQAKINEIRSNTAGPNTFRKRFYDWFNMFRIVKYMNFAHAGLYEKQPVGQAASGLLKALGKSCTAGDPHGLLRYYRMLEKNY